VAPVIDPPLHPVVTVRPFSLSATLGGTVAILGIVCILVTGIVSVLRTLHLTCDRGEGVCAIEASWGPLHSRDTFPIASVRALRVDTVNSGTGSRRRVNYDGFLITDKGDVRISNAANSDPTDHFDAAKRFNAFLVNPSQRSVDIPYDSPQPFSACFFGLACALLLYGNWYLLGSPRPGRP